MYFKTARKCGIFGIADETVPKQTNYLIDEGMSIGKGANSIVSYLHHYLESNPKGRKNHLIIHADNATCVTG